MENSDWQFSLTRNSWITADSIARLEPEKWFSDENIISSSSLFSKIFPLSSVKVFWPHLLADFVKYRDHEAIWKMTHKTLFWLSDVWVFPIHLPNHWMVASVYRKEQRVDLFDSIGLSTGIQEITKVRFFYVLPWE